MADSLHTNRWTEASRRHRRHNPLCVYCARAGRITQAEVVDHIIPRSEAPHLMWEPSNWQSLCKRCHDITKQQEEFYGYGSEVDSTGWPVDPSHPANGGQITEQQKFSIPHFLRPSKIPVTVVVGAPGSGKTTYVRKTKKEGDFVIDFDDIREGLCGERYSSDPDVLEDTFAARTAMLRSLANRTTGQAWFIVGAPSQQERAAWLKVLGKKAKLHVMGTSRDECRRRIEADPQRKQYKDALLAKVDAWFRAQKNKIFQ